MSIWFNHDVFENWSSSSSPGMFSLASSNWRLQFETRPQKLQRAGFSDQMEVDLAGAGFDVAIVALGGEDLGQLLSSNAMLAVMMRFWYIYIYI